MPPKNQQKPSIGFDTPLNPVPVASASVEKNMLSEVMDGNQTSITTPEIPTETTPSTSEVLVVEIAQESVTTPEAPVVIAPTIEMPPPPIGATSPSEADIIKGDNLCLDTVMSKRLSDTLALLRDTNDSITSIQIGDAHIGLYSTLTQMFIRKEMNETFYFLSGFLPYIVLYYNEQFSDQRIFRWAENLGGLTGPQHEEYHALLNILVTLADPTTRAARLGSISWGAFKGALTPTNADEIVLRLQRYFKIQK